MLRLYAAASLAAVAAGCAIAALAGVPATVWGRNIAAWAVGALLAIMATRRAWPQSRVAALIVLAIVVAALFATFVDTGLAGVHRWVSLGPLRLNAAMLLLPLTIVLLARRRSDIAMLAIAAVLLGQPDASQAAAFAAASLIMLRRRGMDWQGRATAMLVVALAAAAWLRADPLAPVAEVEGIFGLASPWLAILGGCALALAALTPALAQHRADPAALPLATYMAVVAVMPVFGTFPVPLVGMTVSPILGWWLAVGLLAASVGLTRPRAAA